jgi:hypothetical protein
MGRIEDHNLLRGQPLTVLVIDHIRERRAVGERVTPWSINKALSDRYKLKGLKRSNLYDRIRTVINSLESSGQLSTEKQWNKEDEKYHRIITLCSD